MSNICCLGFERGDFSRDTVNTIGSSLIVTHQQHQKIYTLPGNVLFDLVSLNLISIT